MPLITADHLRDRLADLCLLDARPAADFAAGHLPGARHADLDRHLSAAADPGHDPARGGRHPLPPLARFARQVGLWGITPATEVVAYDASGGGNAAARLWWMLRALGHARASVLDGGLAAALGAGLPLTPEQTEPAAAPAYPAAAWGLPLVDIDEVDALRADPGRRLLDARSAARWRGEEETLDPVAGRIPGSVNVPWADNLAPDGRFKAPELLRRHYLDLLGDLPPEQLAVHCGSGVTACHTLLALEVAGLPGAALYVGSWSEWCRGGRPQGRG